MAHPRSSDARTPVETRPFGRTGMDVPVLGQGTWRLQDAEAAQRALVRGIELGLTHIDTAELYTGAEQVLRPVLEGRRDALFVVSKVLPHHASRQGTVDACAASLERLGTDRLDVYLLHWPGSHPLEDTMRAMGDLIDDGRIGAAGVSNFDVAGLELAESVLGRHKLACNQVLYHLEERSIEVDVLPWCRDHGVALVGYSPFGSGPFVDPASAGGRVLAEVAGSVGRTSRQVALRFLTREAPLFSIPKAESVAHVEDNAGGAGWTLEPGHVAALDEAFPVPTHVDGVPTL